MEIARANLTLVIMPSHDDTEKQSSSLQVTKTNVRIERQES